MNRLVTFLAVDLFACLLACHPLAFSVDPAFSPDAQAQILRAAADWNTRTNTAHQISFDGNSWHFLSAEPPEGGYNGLTKMSERTIWCRPIPIGATYYDVALHEFGHALGLGHATTGVMMATTVSDEFTPEVMAECRRAGACSNP